MIKTLPREKFFTDAKKFIKAGMPIADLQDLAQKYTNISTEDINAFLKTNLVTSAIVAQTGEDRKKANEVYKYIDKMFIERYPHMVAYQQENNVSFYNYNNGVYVKVGMEDMRILVDKFFIEHNLLEHRTSTHKVKDTISRISALLNYENGKRFNEKNLEGRQWYINVKNGLLNPVTKELLPHTPKYFSLTQAPFEYNSDADCPKFKEAVALSSRNTEGTDIMIQEMFGYVVATDGNPKNKVFYMYGNVARNGKSTIAQVLIGLIGESNVSTLSLEDIASPSKSIIEPIIGKQLNFSDEVDKTHLSSSRLTAISSQGSTQISPKYEPSFSYRVRAKFIVACNYLPNFSSGQGMIHRTIVIPFKYKIPESNRIDNYDKVLLQEEGSGILNWALQGYDRFVENKGMFTLSQDSINDAQENILSNNSVLAYLNDEYEFDANYTDKISTKEMYGTLTTGYVGYCKASGQMPFALGKFSQHMKTFSEEHGKIRYHAKDPRGYSGLKLKIDCEFDNVIDEFTN